MKLRIRFTKEGPVRFVGHLDFMRFMQRVLKKSGLDVVYTGGFNPHMILSFAAPLGVGEETIGDYADVEVAYRDPFPLNPNEIYMMRDHGLQNDELPPAPPAADMLAMLNQASCEGVTFTDITRIGQLRESNAMAIVRYASWDIALADDFLAGRSAEEMAAAVMEKETIPFRKVTKKADKTVDIRPLIVSVSVPEQEEKVIPGMSRHLLLTCAAGSSQNLKPATVLEALAEDFGQDFDPYGFRLLRTELYADGLVPLGKIGEELV